MSRRRARIPAADDGQPQDWAGVVLPDLPPLVRQLALRGKRRAFRGGTLLINEGDPGNTLFIALTGRFKVFSINGDGHEITYGVQERGAIFGEMSLDGGPRSASVLALEACECAVLDNADVKAHVRANPEFALQLLDLVIHRAREATRVARGLALDSAYQRLVQFLDLHTKRPVAEAYPVLRHFTQGEIASRIGTSRETVTRLLKDLEKAGCISVYRFTLTVLQPLPRSMPRLERAPVSAENSA